MKRAILVVCLLVCAGLTPRWNALDRVEAGSGPLREVTLRNPDFRLPAVRQLPGETGLEAQRGAARPTALASADLDEDGVPDLVCGYAVPDGGVVTVHRGNLDTIYPNSPEARQRRSRGEYTDSPFLTPARTFELPERPDFLGAGDFDNDGHLDVVTAAHGDDGLYLVPGDGKGGLGPPLRVAVPGQVTAMVTGEVNRPDGLADVALAVQAGESASLLVFEGPSGALRGEPEVLALPTTATDLVLGRLDDDPPIDLAVAVDRELLIVHGRDRRLSLDEERRAEVDPAGVDRIAVPGTILAVAVGDFVWEASQRQELALLLVDGVVRVLGREGAPTGSLGKQRREVRQWAEVLEHLVARADLTSAPAAGRRLLAARVSGLPMDDLIVLDASRPRLHLVMGAVGDDLERGGIEVDPVSADLERQPVAALPMRLNGDALSDLVILGHDGGGPAVALSAPRVVFTVDSTIDDKDTNPGDGVCVSVGAVCTLRAAIEEANALAGADEIRFGIGTGPQTIAPEGALPAITEAVTIDGTTQPGFAGTPIIELNGISAGLEVDGLSITAGSSTVRGLVVNRFDNDGIETASNGGNVIEGNFIGTDIAGTADMGNGARGVQLADASGNTVGGATAAARNVISGNEFAGIRIIESDGNDVQGNHIGTDVTGTSGLGNGLQGVRILDASGNTVGGSTAGAGNVISANARDGVLIRSSSFPAANTTLNLVQGNYIGTNVTGTADLGNVQNGVEIRDSSSNTVGGTTAGTRNVISGNGIGGVFIFSVDSPAADTSLNLVQGNYIGTDGTGAADLGNATTGVEIRDARSNTVGGTTAEAGNVISANGTRGVFIRGLSSPAADTTLNLVQGNYIGTDATGTADLGNSLEGVRIQDATANTIGGTTAGAVNVISSNNLDGVIIVSLNSPAADTTLNVVQGNRIGTDVDGTAPLGNGESGVEIRDAASNTVGGTTAGAGNVISSNTTYGVYIDSFNSSAAETTLNLVQGNYIGTDVTGTVDLGNTLDGVLINAAGNTVGGTSVAARNLISGNDRIGVYINSFVLPAAETTLNLVQGNYIGTDISGTADLGNTLDGVFISDAAGNTIGGTSVAARNLISGNDRVGVGIFSSNGGSTGNNVQGNYIGTDVNGDAILGNDHFAVGIYDSSGNTVGGAGAGAGNRIAGNGGPGIAVGDLEGTSTGNAILGNSILSNAGLGIDLGDDGITPNDPLDADGSPNNLQNFPIVTSFTIGATDTAVSGTLHSTPGTAFRVELFTNTACDPTGYGEGERFLGFIDVATDASGDASFTGTFPNTAPPGSFVTGTATDPAGNTSEFSPCGAPFVIAVVPEDDAVEVLVGTNVTLTFSEVLNASTVTTSTILLLDPDGTPVPAIVGLAPDGVTVTLDPDPTPSGELSLGTIYRVEVTGGVEDLIGAPAVPFTSLFRTVDVIPVGTPLALVSDQSALPVPPGPAPPPGMAPRAPSVTSGPNLGFSVAQAGDLDDDGLADFVGGAPGYSLDSVDEMGMAAIYLGSAEQSERTQADLIFTGAAAHDRAGVAVVSGFDFDGDGTNDILVGAEQMDRTQDPAVSTGNGKVYLILFRPSDYDRAPVDGVPDYEVQPEMFVSLDEVGTTISGVVFSGEASADRAGFAVAGGSELSPTPDAFDDIVIGAPGVNAEDGRAYVVLGTNDPLLEGARDLADVAVGGMNDIPGAVYDGPAGEGERLGWSVALPGDVTGGPAGRDDIAMGAPGNLSEQDTGKVYVLAGESPASFAVEIRGDQACEQLGFAVAAGGDNRADEGATDPDLLIGAPGHDIGTGDVCDEMNATAPDAGRVVQTSARLSAGVIDVAEVGVTVEGVIWNGSQSGGKLGWWATRLGDVTGNTHEDIGFGAPFATAGPSGAGVVYLIEGKAIDGTAVQDLSGTVVVSEVGQTTSGGIFLGTQTDERAGLIMAAAGDLDGNPVYTGDDFTIGAPGWAGEIGTVHQALRTILREQGECTAAGCKVADLATGATMTVPPASLAHDVKLAVEGLVDPATGGPLCGTSFAEDSTTKTLVGLADYRRVDQPALPDFDLPLDIEVPTSSELEFQLTNDESLDLRYCDISFGWTKLSAPLSDTGVVKDNSYRSGRKAVDVVFDPQLVEDGVDTLRLYGVFFADDDADSVRNSCDCDDADDTIWAPPGNAQDLILAHDAGSGTTLQWGPTDHPGGDVVLYDVIRADDPAACRLDPSTCFVTSATCVDFDVTVTTAVDVTDPFPGGAFFYIVSAENGCLTDPGCRPPVVSRPAVDCIEP